MSAKQSKESSLVQYVTEKIHVQKLHPGAEFPYRENPTDVGYDMTLVARTDNRAEDDTGDVNNFNTGIALTPPDGYYLEMVAMPALHKHGYMLATGTHIINPGFVGEIIVPLYKYKEAEDLELPFRAVQLVVKPALYAHLKSVSSLGSVDRGMGGYSSGMMMQQQGAYIPDPRQASYMGDMNGYNSHVNQNYSQGVPRPQSAAPRNNHMF